MKSVVKFSNGVVMAQISLWIWEKVGVAGRLDNQHTTDHKQSQKFQTKGL